MRETAFPGGYIGNRFFVKVPPDRLGVLIGEKGSVKEQIENSTGVLLTIDSNSGIVVIEPASPGVSPENLMKARDVVNAIAIGFSPERALRLLEEDQMLTIIDLKEVVGQGHHLTRIKARLIGEKGKTRKILEETTGAFINIGENTVGIIGDYEQTEIARQAISMLIEGRPHSAVYSFLERASRKLKRRRLRGLWQDYERG